MKRVSQTLQRRTSSRNLEILPKRKVRLGFLNIRDPEIIRQTPSRSRILKKAIAHFVRQAFLNPGMTPTFMGVFLLVPFFLTACMVGPDYITPSTEVPIEWVNTTEVQQKSLKSIQEEVTWWENYKDPILTELVQETINSNYSLKIAFANICQARAALLGAEAKFFPEIDAIGSYSRNLNSLNAAQFFNQQGASSLLGATPPTPITVAVARPFNLYRIGFDTTWEIDLFGRIRRGIEAAEATLEAQVDDMHNVLITLIAEVAENYINLRSFQKQLEITKKSFEAWDAIYKLNQALLKAGLATDIEVSQAKASRDRTEANIPPLQANIKTTIHQLSILIGKPPTCLYDLLCKVKPIPQIPQEFFLGLPSTLLCQRPDILAAERNLAAATAEIGVAEGGLFPIFTFTGIVGYQSNMLNNLFSPKSTFYSFGPGFTWDLVDFGRVRAMINQAVAVRDQNFYQYKNTVLAALADVENALVNYASGSRRFYDLGKAYEASKKAADISLLRYESGLINFITVYQAEIAYQTIELSLVQSQAALALSSVALYKSLGGGWEIDPICWDKENPPPCLQHK